MIWEDSVSRGRHKSASRGRTRVCDVPPPPSHAIAIAIAALSSPSLRPSSSPLRPSTVSASRSRFQRPLSRPLPWPVAFSLLLKARFKRGAPLSRRGSTSRRDGFDDSRTADKWRP
ncbi:hypothetical protein M758_9G031900 [Ceratodon purpureus]|uniref:Uncharacterized protein n=1 Tax=Ceratodon purpureus TaxID=3225 RepID=A0A8T0GN75_CERPU|nr:hypothetical protein KC19_9G029900 [Ceratodon purpureus]KAG0605107.1 hypothetical protein M758_9G031900 [Ceratodon purpureus]